MQQDKSPLPFDTSHFHDKEKALQNLRLLHQTSFGGRLDELFKLVLSVPSPDDALNNLERISQALSPETIALFLKDKKGLKNLVTICGASNLLSGTMVKNPGCIEEFFLKKGLAVKKGRKIFFEELETSVRNLSAFDSVAKALRIFKEKEYLRIGARDILGLASMQEVTLELSELASASLEIAYRFCLNQLKTEYGTPVYTDADGMEKESEFAIIGMGKLGGMELNFSSDIDIIYIYSSDKGETTGVTLPAPLFGKEGERRGTVSLHAFYVKLSEMITKLIGAVTEDGIVFRVDLNLRPEGKNGDLANSLRSAEIYYESWGQTWERAAMIKARPVAGSINLGEEFLKMIEPFVYRKYLDFTAIYEIKGMKEKIDISLLRAAPDAIDVKLGRGGIREIEFFVQAIQLINGGKDKAIRQKNTLSALNMLSERGYIADADRDALKNAYIFLRNLEHRIQIVEGRQTQVIPAKAAETARLAALLGFRDGQDGNRTASFWNEYTKQAGLVYEIYNSLFFKAHRELEQGIPEDALFILGDEAKREEIVSRLSVLGFQDPDIAYENLKLLKDGPPFAHFSPRAKMLLKKIAPFLLTRIIKSPAPDMAMKHLERFLSQVGARTAFYSLLSENKKVMELLVKLFGTSVFLSAALTEHPENIDSLLSRELNKPFKNREELFEDISQALDAAADYEDALDSIRRFKTSEILRIGINDIFGTIEPEAVSKQITYLADACLNKACEIASEELKKRFGCPGNDSRFIVLALGKMGGEELIYSSDLDIVFIYSKQGETSGPKTISNHEFFAKLAQRIITILSIATKEGFAFKVDTRLRPSGSAGPLVVSEEAFIRYQKETAEIWERQSMLKARFAAGDAEFGARIIDELQKCIYSSPPAEDDLKELYRIRKRMEIEIAKEGGGKYNIKYGRGGLVDVEFTVQLFQLKFGVKESSISKANTIEAIEKLKEARIISETDYSVLRNAYLFYRKLENRIRIVQNRSEAEIIKDSPELLALAKRLGYEDRDAGKRLLEDYLNHAEKTRELYLRTIGIKEAR